MRKVRIRAACCLASSGISKKGKGRRYNSQVGWNSDNSVGYLVSEISLGSFFHLLENHGRHFFRGEDLFLTTNVDLDGSFTCLLNELNIGTKGTAKRQKISLIEYFRFKGKVNRSKGEEEEKVLTSNGNCFLSFLTSASFHLRPIRRLASKLWSFGEGIEC